MWGPLLKHLCPLKKVHGHQPVEGWSRQHFLSVLGTLGWCHCSSSLHTMQPLVLPTRVLPGLTVNSGRVRRAHQHTKSLDACLGDGPRLPVRSLTCLRGLRGSAYCTWNLLPCPSEEVLEACLSVRPAVSTGGSQIAKGLSGCCVLVASMSPVRSQTKHSPHPALPRLKGRWSH